MHRLISGCAGTGPFAFIGGNGNSTNAAAGDYSGVLSGSSNNACDEWSGIVAGVGNIINTFQANSASVIAGGSNNAIAGGFAGGFEGFIGAGSQNAVNGGDNTFIGSGDTNAVSADDSFVGGGYHNTLSGAYGVLAGGANSKVSGQYASIGGGNTNTASGTESTVPGGGANTASGYASFAAGYHANANQAGSFVWSDSSSSNATKPTVAYQFVARASGGVEFFSNAAMTTGVKLAAGGGSWASLSDRAVKTNVEPIDDAQILERVASMPISEWSYISERGVRHVGPMAQDFYAAFGVGEDNKHITSIDEDGVALVAIKALNARLEQRDAALQHQMEAMKAQMLRHDALVQKEMEQLVARMSSR